MDKVTIDLKNCYGIKELKQNFDFSQTRAYAIYAPNGSMKSSLAQTFQDVAEGTNSSDRIFPARKTIRKITDEHDAEVKGDRVLAVKPYNEQIGPTEKTSTLLMDAKLKKEFVELHAEINKAKEDLLKAVKQQSNSKANFEVEISSAFTTRDDQFQTALTRIRKELNDLKETPFADVHYDKIFNDKVVGALGTKDLKSLIEEYIRRYNELLAASTFFKRGTFDYYNAGQIAKSLTDNGFFEANHTVNLNAVGKRHEISTQKELEDIITQEKEAILKDEQLRKKFDGVANQLQKNAPLREFYNYLLDNEALLSRLNNLAGFKEDILKSYLKVHQDRYLELMKKYDDAEKRRKRIEEDARKQRTQWEVVIEMFNHRFFVPFKLEAKNRTAVILGEDAMLDLAFTYHDGEENVGIEKDDLLKVLSSGEKKALYILNVIFEIETRKKANQETLIVIDDLADSFDYQNKYAIIQYLKDISEDGLFKLIIMTHNFDFFRTIESRFVNYSHCLVGSKSDKGIILAQAEGIKNVFANDWRQHFFLDSRKKVASIPFLRNLIEFSRGDGDPNFQKLTSLLHWKPDSGEITVGELDAIYNVVCATDGSSDNATKLVYDLIMEEADSCLNADAGLNFENKIVLAIAIRIDAERFMVGKINDANFVSGISSNQTQVLIAKIKEMFPDETETNTILDRVSLMTPENIHLNSFMYEPIIDMSDEHLKKLYGDLKSLA